MKDELGGVTMKEFIRWWPKTYSYVKGDKELETRLKELINVSSHMKRDSMILKVAWKHHKLKMKLPF